MYDSTQAVRFIRSHESFVILGHKEPDGDCVASQIACATLLRALGKEATLHSAGPFDRPEISPFEKDFSPVVSKERRAAAAVVILDCSTPDRTGPLGEMVAGMPALVIDHHSAGERFGDARMVEPSAPSTTIIVLDLFEALGVTPDADTARLILFGLCTDTGFFRHLGTGSADTYRAIARLVECGTSTADVYMLVYGRRELASRKLLAEMLLSAESHSGWPAHRDLADDRRPASACTSTSAARMTCTGCCRPSRGTLPLRSSGRKGRGPFPWACAPRRPSMSAPLPRASAEAGTSRRPGSTSRGPWNR